MEARALHSFEAHNEDELSFHEGTIVKFQGLPQEQGKGWVRAELNGREGYVPVDYFEMKEHDWFVPNVTREQACDKLKGLPDGTFLVRTSENCPGDFSITVRHQNQDHHSKILRDGSGKYFLWIMKFNSINEIIAYHQTNSMSRSQHILLKEPFTFERFGERVEAKFDFEARGADELGFKKGDVIQVLEKPENNWWRGKLNDKEGLFPVPYVEVPEATE